MPRKGPHISIPYEKLVPRVLSIPADELAQMPQGVRELTSRLAAELFLTSYNPFIDSAMVRRSVSAALDEVRPSLSPRHGQRLEQAIADFWRGFDGDQQFKAKVLERLRQVLPPESISTNTNALIETATDATDLRMELPMLVVNPGSTEEVQAVVRLAGELDFKLVPRGGGTGATGGAIPATRRTVVLSLSRLKRIIDIDTERRILRAQTGVLTLNAIKAAEELGLLFTVDPASKAASSLGGNISENSGGPYAFEYGVTLDNILSFTQVMPNGEIIEVRRVDHPRHKILPEEVARFEIVGEDGRVKDVIDLPGDRIRGKDLGKDVSDKYLGGLPGVQKEGVDGVITECAFILYPLPKLSRTLCLEFYGRSMHNAMRLITDVVAYRDQIRAEGDLVKVSALEEFGPKYVQAINYVKKSSSFEGEPISVLLIQMDSDDSAALDRAVDHIVELARSYENMDVFSAKDPREAEHFWEDRHKLSAIAKRTSGFKVNEDIVIPLAAIPTFSDFLEDLNLVYLAKAYRAALTKVGELEHIPAGDEAVAAEQELAREILKGDSRSQEMNDQEFEVRIAYFFRDLAQRYPEHAEALGAIHAHLTATRIVIANHMHAGDGNCHVNLPVNSGDPQMLAQAHHAAGEVFEKVLSLGGAVSGEHGIGITKIGFLTQDKIDALRAYKAQVDPQMLINPGKLVRRELTVEPYTFSFNRLIQDLDQTSLPDKERLMGLLRNIQTCTRCGKCKQACAMYLPQAGMMFHPRNKNISLGALIEAIYYSLLETGQPDRRLMGLLRELMEHCTACGKCFGVCPVKIDSSDVALHLRAFLEDKRAGGHPVKSHVLRYLAAEAEKRVPFTAKLLSVGQKAQDTAARLLPTSWRQRLEHPLAGPAPAMDFHNLREVLHLGGSYLLAPEDVEDGRDVPETVFYFPGCGAGLFSTDIGAAAISLLLARGVSVLIPDRHLCCGYPLLAQGLEDAYLANYGHNLAALRKVLEKARRKGFHPQAVLTSCGTCRESLARSEITTLFGADVVQKDIVQYLFEHSGDLTSPMDGQVLYHAACHAEWAGVPKAKAAARYRQALAEATGLQVRESPGCCGESGLGALTSPAIYNKLRARKRGQLEADLARLDKHAPVVVGCPSCKVGVSRILLDLDPTRKVMHTAEFLAQAQLGAGWKSALARAIQGAPEQDGLRFVPDLDRAPAPVGAPAKTPEKV